MSFSEFVAVTIEEKHYQCPVCANFDTYAKLTTFTTMAVSPLWRVKASHAGHDRPDRRAVRVP